MQPTAFIRRATMADAAAIRGVQHDSLRQLGAGHYEGRVIEAAIRAGVLEPELIQRGRYFVALRNGEIVGCGGWTDGGPTSPFEPRAPWRHAAGQPATIRSVYVAPEVARLGIGSALMQRIESDAVAAGRTRATLTATLMAVRFYACQGYRLERAVEMQLPSGELIEVFAMHKTLDTACRLSA